MSGVVIAVMARRKKLVRTFKQANAVSIGSSIDTRHFNIRESFLFKKMVAEGIFVSIAPHCYYLDETREHELRKQRHKVVLILVAVSIIAILITVFVANRPSFAN